MILNNIVTLSLIDLLAKQDELILLREYWRCGRDSGSSVSQSSLSHLYVRRQSMRYSSLCDWSSNTTLKYLLTRQSRDHFESPRAGVMKRNRFPSPCTVFSHFGQLSDFRAFSVSRPYRALPDVGRHLHCSTLRYIYACRRRRCYKTSLLEYP